MTETKKKHRSRAASLMVMEWSRYLVLDRCLCDRMQYYHLEDLMNELISFDMAFCLKAI